MTGPGAVAAVLARGELAVIPTDTVYGLACLASSKRAAGRLYALKGRQAIQPTAVVFPRVDSLLRALPGLREEHRRAVHALLPGPFTLVLPNPERRYAWLNADRPEALGVRVPSLPASAAVVVERVGPVVATSANLPGGRDPRRLADVPESIRAGVAALLDAGELPGTPSTVLDLTGAEPLVLRAGAADPEAALAAVAARAPGVPGRGLQ